MPGVNEAQAAGRMHERVITPLVEQLRARGTLIRLAFVTIDAVDPSPGYAAVTFEGGHSTVLPYGVTAPAVGERWRVIAYGGSGFVLDDLAVAYA